MPTVKGFSPPNKRGSRPAGTRRLRKIHFVTNATRSNTRLPEQQHSPGQVLIVSEPFGVGIDVFAPAGADGTSRSREFPTYRQAREYSDALASEFGWHIVDHVLSDGGRVDA